MNLAPDRAKAVVTKGGKTGNSVLLDPGFYRCVIDSLPLGVVAVDPNLRAVHFNPGAEKITGYTEKDVIGRSCGEILRGGMCNARCPLKTVITLEQSFVDLETTIRTTSGTLIPVRMKIAGLFDRNGKLIGGVEAFYDITHSKALERKSKNFISILAHDMKSPVVSIHGFAHRLLRKPDLAVEKERLYLEIIESEAARLESLIDDFVELSRLQSGKLKLCVSETSLSKELHELYEIYKPLAFEHGLELELDIDEALPLIEGDSKQLRRVFTNLLDNAVKFSGEAGVVTIAARGRTEDIIVQIRDKGIGIAPEDQAHVFDPFHRGLVTGKKRQGFGLGLAGAKAIVEAHGGDIQLESTLGRGSIFSVRLPKKRKMEKLSR